MECNGGAEKKKTYMSTITLEMKSSRESPAQGCGVTSTENGTALKGKKKTQRDTRKGPAVEFVDPVENVQVHVGETAQLFCSFNCSGPTASCWIHNRKKVVLDGDRTRIESSTRGSVLTISEVLPVDVGSYTIFVQTRRGLAEHTIVLSICDRPEPPASCPFVSQLTPSSLVLSWSGPNYDGGSQITDYVVEMQNFGPAESGDWSVLTSECKDTTYRVCSGLHAQGEYCFRVRACNAVGVSEPSEESDCIKMITAGGLQEEALPQVDVVIDTTHKVKDVYNIHEKLGVGKFGQVFRLTHKETGRVCAGKFYRAFGSKDKAAAREEIKLMKGLHHPKLVQCLGAFDTRSEIVLIMEYIAGGELFERIVDDNFEHTEPNSMKYMRQILEGILYLHHKCIVHLDLKPENIVCINATGTCIKIIDFGLARKLEPGKPLMVMHGTPEFVAPEVICYEPVTLATDMWSIGVICYILLSGESPFQGNTDAETLALVTAATWEFDPEFDDITDEAKDFICKLLKKEKSTRMSCEQALAHLWMASSAGRVTKSLNKDKMRHFLARQRWRRTGKAVLALQRMTNLSNRSDGSDSPTSTLNDTALEKEAEDAVVALEQQLRSEPNFPQTLHDLTEPCGATVYMACIVQGYPDPEVVWLFNDKPLEETERVQIEYKDDGLRTLTLTQVQPRDSGIYEIRASNHLGQALCSARLTVAN
ncbi:myosin light chain kinase, smooth muscle-like isoform X2 [Neoarius graeffei]|uniref:myosin light chain kinase, smooth muscle-like isoform X2 n=1 Tax=Neoarius graeffei TaxID=443677 RepID=UPI00298C0EFB|nr:myosin light chain kinase, smooth muscle-like isoform X2 [Neoarius graeffei]